MTNRDSRDSRFWFPFMFSRILTELIDYFPLHGIVVHPDGTQETFINSTHKNVILFVCIRFVYFRWTCYITG